MKDEIKEILDRLYVYRNENDEMKYQPEDILTIEDVWLLLDYITNLEQYYNENVNKYEELLVKYSTLNRWYNSSKSRNEKAIKYINEMCLCSDGYCDYGDDLRPEHIVNILTGGDEDD